MKGLKLVSMACWALIWTYAAHASDGATTDKLSEILKKGKLLIATEAEYPPMTQLIKGGKRPADTRCFSNEYTAAEFTGFEADVAKEAAHRLGVEACFVTPTWAEVSSGGWADRWDIAFNGVSITTERLETLYFAQPYYAEPAAFYVHQSNTAFQQPADLSGKKIGLCSGCIFEYYLEGTLTLPGQNIASAVTNAEIIAYEPEAEIVADLALGDGVKLDAMLTTIFIGNQAIADGRPIKQLGAPVLYTYVAPAIDKKQSRNPIPFVTRVSAIITQLHTDGTLAALAKKYFTFDSDVVTPARKFDLRALQQYP